MSIVRLDKETFFNKDGSVLELGYIYIGQPNTDPRTYPKTVTLQDSGGSQFTASQPLRTGSGSNGAGKIVYNGQPITASVDGEHSILILNSAGGQVDYTASYDPGSASAATTGDTIRVGLLLDDIKGFDVSVGDVVRNVGKLIATDALGADWLVVSATGSPGDDVDLIDFDNGLQGRRDKSKLYRASKQVWSGSATEVNVNLLSDTSPGIYIVVAPILFGVEYLLASRVDLSTTTAVIVGSSLGLASDVGGGIINSGCITCQVTLSGPNKIIKVTSRYVEIDTSGPSFSVVSEDATITAIYKFL